MEKRDQVIRFRCTKDERLLIEKAATAEFADARQISSYIRKLVFLDIKEKLEKGELSSGR